MYQYIESIKVEDGQLKNLASHQARLDRTIQANYKNCKGFDLEALIQLPSDLDHRLYKCRFCYNETDHTVEFVPYQRRTIRSLKLVECQKIDYSYKSTDRWLLNELYAQRGDADDIIITRNGYLTDTWATNILLCKDQKWYTPKQPLLQGTQRELLIKSGVIFEEDIHRRDLENYDRIRLINAMVTFEDEQDISINQIK